MSMERGRTARRSRRSARRGENFLHRRAPDLAPDPIEGTVVEGAGDRERARIRRDGVRVFSGRGSESIQREREPDVRKKTLRCGEATSVVATTCGVRRRTAKKALLELKPFFTDHKLLVSIAAGIKMKDLQEWSGHGRIIRVMPNTPSAVGEAASVMCMGDMATTKDEERVASLFKAIGKIWMADEKYFDAVTGLSGSGPAYVYIAIEALADGGVAAGLPRDLAHALATQTVLGAAAMVNKSGKHPGQLKDAVTSPAGTTIAGIHELEKAGFRGSLISAVIAAAKRCRELS